VQQLIRRHNIDHHQLSNPVVVVERHPMTNAPSAVVPHYRKLLEPKMAHHFHLVKCHGALRVIGMIFTIRWPAAVAVSTQVCSNYGEFSGQRGRDFVSHHVCLRVAM
jgi:hypothetical protein